MDETIVVALHFAVLNIPTEALTETSTQEVQYVTTWKRLCSREQTAQRVNPCKIGLILRAYF